MKIIIYLLLIIIILLLIYHLNYNSQEPFRKKLKKLKKRAKKTTQTIAKPINKAVVAPVVAPINKHVVKPALNVIKRPTNAFNNFKKTIQKNIIKPIKLIIHPPPPPPKPTRPYEYNFHSNLPKQYKEEVLSKIGVNFNEPKPLEDRFITEDKNHKCIFKYNPKVKDLKFVRTIMNPKYNFDYSISSTSCGPNIPEDKCNKDTNYDMKSTFIEETPNQYINYELDKNKVFLHYKDDENGTIKTFKDYNNVAYEDINPIYNTKYNVCEPSESKFTIDIGFDANCPCSVLVCGQVSDEEKHNTEEINYENLNENAKTFYDNIVQYEHQGAIDKVLQSVGFNAWIDILNQTQEMNTNVIKDYENYDDSKLIIE